MTDNEIKIPKSLIDALKRGQVVPFVGAGVSLVVRKKNKDGTKSEESLFPSWKEYVEILAKALEDENKPQDAALVRSLVNISKPKYLDAMQHAFQELGKDLWYEKLDEHFKIDETEAAQDSLELPQLIWNLGSNVIFTTNIDRVLEWKSVKDSPIEIIDRQKVEAAQLQRNENPPPTIFYQHGRVGDKENIVFTREQYDNFYRNSKNEAKLRTLQAFLTSKAFLFIGFSLDDDYFVEQLKNIHAIYEGGASRYYALIKESDAGKLKHLGFVKEVYFEGFGEPLLKVVREMRDIAGKAAGGEEEPEPPPKTPENLLKNHFNVPFASKGDACVGREGLREKIWESLSKSGRAAIGQAVAIKGIGGLGKTQLAVEYAHTYRNRYENGVFWLTADEDINIQLIKIGEDLNWISQFDTGFDQAELVRNRFRKLSGCLIIFDNVDERKAIENYLPESGARPHVLITSREKQEFFDEINLDVLHRAESRKLLLEVSGRSLKVSERSPEDEANETAFEKILEELGDLPLAVELVGGFLAEHQIISFRDYLGFLDEVPLDDLEKDFPSISFTHHDKSIIRTLKISEKVLTKKPYLEEILDLLAWSGKSSMGYSLLQSLIGIENNYTLTTALSDLVNLRLIKEEKPAKRYTIHRLVARVRRFEKPLAERKEWHQKIVAKLVEWFRRRKDEFEYLAEFENETIHLQQWQSESVDILPIETVYLTNFEAYPLWHRGNYQESKILLEKALNLYQENQLNDEKLLANLYNDLGVIAQRLGNINQGLEFHQKALSIGNSVFDEKSEDIAKFLNNLGIIYDELGNYRKALELKEQALKIRQRLFGEKHPDIADSLNNLGYTYDKLGNHQKALELNEQASEMRQGLFGEKHPDIAFSLNNLASTYALLNNHQKALELNERALKMQQELFGEKHPDIAESLNNLGYTYDILDNYQKAANFYESALKMRRELLGEKHPRTILTCGNLIRVLSKLGKREQAGRLAGEFLSYVPQNHPRRRFFEEYGAAYRKARKKKKRRGK
jgi:tetratricopeptide (TPR) repeat protein